MSKQNDLIIDGINISSLRLHLEIGRKCTISTEELLKVLDILENLYQENKQFKDKQTEFNNRFGMFVKDLAFTQKINKEINKKMESKPWR